MMTVRVYKSTDPGAPTLGPGSGSLIAVLDACLVNGYGDKVAAGWEKVYEDSTLRAAYMQGRGNRHIFFVDDSGGTLVRCNGCAAIDENGNGLEKFPFDTSLYVFKHDGLAGNRDWIVVASEDLFYFISQYSDNVNWTSAFVTIFGKIRSYMPDDKHDAFIMAAHRDILYGDPTAQTTGGAANINNISSAQMAINCTLQPVAEFPGHFMARRWHGGGSAAPVLKFGNPLFLSEESVYKVYQRHSGMHYVRLGADTLPTPNAVDGSIYLTQIKIIESGPTFRGEIPGMWQSYVSATYYRPLDIIEGTGPHAGKQFMHVPMWHGNFMLEVSDTW